MCLSPSVFQSERYSRRERSHQCLFAEVKVIETVHPIHKAQMLSYRKWLDIPLGLVINFHSLKLTDGVSPLMLPGAKDQ
jgi:hypothetical protein